MDREEAVLAVVASVAVAVAVAVAVVATVASMVVAVGAVARLQARRGGIQVVAVTAVEAMEEAMTAAAAWEVEVKGMVEAHAVAVTMAVTEIVAV